MSIYSILGMIVLILDVVAILSVLLGASSPLRKVVWILVTLFLPLIGMVLYFLFGRSVADA